ncbi:MAG: hypothetical protein ACSLFN_02790 [Candidatus Limnocylindrales bacterium]
MAATREFLARSQSMIEERLLAVDDRAIVGRHDSGQWERIMARHEGWPVSVGLVLEWPRSVDPAGPTRPKLGVFWWADPPTLVQARTEFVKLLDAGALQKLGLKVPLESVWPVGGWAPQTSDWWRDPEAWISTIAETLVATWSLVGPAIDGLFPVEPVVSHG